MLYRRTTNRHYTFLTLTDYNNIRTVSLLLLQPASFFISLSLSLSLSPTLPSFLPSLSSVFLLFLFSAFLREKVLGMDPPHPTAVPWAQWKPTESPSRANPKSVSVPSRVFQAPPPPAPTTLLWTVPPIISIWWHPMILSHLPLYSSQGRGKGHSRGLARGKFCILRAKYA